MIDVFVGVLFAFLAYDYVISPALNYLSDLAAPVMIRIRSWLADEPYLNEKHFLIAYKNWMAESATNTDMYEEFLDEDGSVILKICPKCIRFKRNFAKQGRDRICMDCEFKIGDKNG